MRRRVGEKEPVSEVPVHEKHYGRIVDVKENSPAVNTKEASIDLDAFCRALEDKIREAYESSITMAEAEKLAGEFLGAQMVIARELQSASLNSRMRKQGVKALKATLYLSAVKASDKKPTEATLTATIDSSPLVESEQKAFDAAEVEAEALENYLRIFEQAHHYFKQLSKSNG